MNNYIKNFRFFCQKVLPLVYDDSLSYYEVLCKAIGKMNEIGNVVNIHSNSIENLGKRYVDLEHKVDGLIDNLINVIVPWDSSIAYNIFSVVEYQGTNYIAIQDVPVGIMITNTEYWEEANTIIAQVNAIGVTVANIERNYLERFKKPFKFIIASDIHYSQRSWYGHATDYRMRKFVDAMNYEIRQNTIDGIILLGDLSLDYWTSGGSLSDGLSNTDVFCSQYVPMIYDNGIIITPGNHECGYTDTQWKNITGNPRQFTVANRDKKVAFIICDTYRNNSETQYNTDGVYHNIDTTWLQSQLNILTDYSVFIAAHYIDVTEESDELKNIVKENDNVIALISAHGHVSDVTQLGTEWGDKYLIRTGHFSYASSTYTLPTECMWGYRTIELTNSGIKSAYVVPPYDITYEDVNYTQNTYTEQDVITFPNSDYDYTIDTLFELDRIHKNNEIDTLFGANELETGADLNTITKEGVYIAPSTAVANSLVNAPFSNFISGFRMTVFRPTSSAGTVGSSRFVVQQIETADTIFNKVKRYYNPSTGNWSRWFELKDTYVTNNSESIYYRTPIEQLISKHEYHLVTSSSSYTKTVDYKDDKGKIHLVVCGKSIGGTISGIKVIAISEPYLSTGSIAIYDIFSSDNLQDLQITSNANSVTFATSGSNYRIYEMLI